MKDATRVVRAGCSPARQGASLLPGPTFASIFHCSGDPSQCEYSYGRFHNPTWTAFEQALELLEGGPAVSFASGMAAVSGLLGTVLKSGDILVVSEDCYYTTRLLPGEQLRSLDLTVRTIDSSSSGWEEALSEAALLWVETPSNPHLNIYDVRALVKLAKQAGALVAVDNTTCTPLLQKPLLLGADFSVASDSKALAGHGDLILGHVAARSGEWAERLRLWRTRMGAVPGPMEIWLTHRSLGSLDVRLDRMCSNAERIAELLQRHERVQKVYYPGLKEGSGRGFVPSQMYRPGYVVSFELSTRQEADRFLQNAQLIDEATSFGSLHTTAERRARWGGDRVNAGFIRLSAGCEDPDDLAADIDRALS